MSTPSLLLVATAGPVTTLTLNRPAKRNALNIPLLGALCRAVAATEAAAGQRILVLRGAGPVFCSGLDLAEAGDAGSADRSAECIEAALRAIAATRLITIAAVQGAAIAGGAGLMNACDFAIATRDAKFGYPEVRRGIVPALIMTLLRRQVAERHARQLLLLGKPFTAERALALGLIDRMVETEAALSDEVQALARSLLEAGPDTLVQTKRLLTELWPASLAADFARARAVHLAGRSSAEATEGIAAFNQKRPPTWAPR